MIAANLSSAFHHAARRFPGIGGISFSASECRSAWCWGFLADGEWRHAGAVELSARDHRRRTGRNRGRLGFRKMDGTGQFLFSDRGHGGFHFEHGGQMRCTICSRSVIGVSFGLLFQRDLRGYGSSMAWGMAYGIFWWFLGPLTILPFGLGQPLDWSYVHASVEFAPLIGNIITGLIDWAGLLSHGPFMRAIPHRIRPDPSRAGGAGRAFYPHGAVGRAAGLAGGLLYRWCWWPRDRSAKLPRSLAERRPRWASRCICASVFCWE